MIKNRKITILFTIFIFLLIQNIYGNDGVIRGRVIDKVQNIPLIGANVTLIGTPLGAASDANGEFQINNVPPGVYAVQVTVIGYTPETATDLMVGGVRDIVLDFELEQTVIGLEGITVRPNYFNSIVEKPISARTQTNEEIRRLPGGLEDVVRAVSILPGVAQVQSGRNDLIVRGGAPSENLYVIDGLEIANINHFGTQGASGGPLSFINLDFVESTTFSTGGFGVRYGDRLSSVLTLNLRDGREDRIGGKGLISYSQFGMNLEGPVGEKGNFVFSARRSYLDFIFKAAGFGFVPEYWDFLAKTNYDLTTNDNLEILFIGALDKTRFFNDTPEKRYTNSRILGSSQDQLIAGITWRHLFRGGFSTVTLGRSEIDFRFNQSDTLGNPIFLNNSLEREYTLTNNWIFNLSRSLELNWGIQGKFVDVSTRLLVPGFTDDFNTSFSVDLDQDISGYKSAGWMQATYTLPKWQFIAGLRMDGFDLYKLQSAFSPRTTINYRLQEGTTLNVHWGRYQQAPAFVWLNANSLNNDLDYIQTDQVILGIEQLLRDDLQMTVEGYYKDYSNYPASTQRPYLVMANTGAGFGGSDDGYASFGLDPLVNEGTGWSRGVEVFLQKKLSDLPFYGIFSLSYNQSRFKGLDGISKPSSYDQRWITNFGGGYVINNRWEISFKSRLATGRPYTPYNPDYTKSIELYNSERIPNNWIVDLRVDRFWFFDGWMMVTFIDIQNVFNRPIYDVPRYNAFDDELEDSGSIGILPSIGIGVEF